MKKKTKSSKTEFHPSKLTQYLEGLEVQLRQSAHLHVSKTVRLRASEALIVCQQLKSVLSGVETKNAALNLVARHQTSTVGGAELLPTIRTAIFRGLPDLTLLSRDQATELLELERDAATADTFQLKRIEWCLSSLNLLEEPIQLGHLMDLSFMGAQG